MMAKKRLDKSGSLEFHPQLEHKIRTRPRKFKFTDKQVQFLNIILNPNNSIIFVSGPAGSSKTYMAIYAAIQLMAEDRDRQLLYVRSIAESADKGLGSLPGDIAEKFDPFLMPLYDKLEEIVQPQDVVWLKKQELISAVPINFLRGASWTNKVIVADECQNFTLKELTTLITRIGEGSKLIICGDIMQSDIGQRSGFKNMFTLFSDEESKEKGVQTFTFNHTDIVRSEILKFLVYKLEKIGATV
jgi:phosphate starvation-inducible PhoH-like protein